MAKRFGTLKGSKCKDGFIYSSNSTDNLLSIEKSKNLINEHFPDSSENSVDNWDLSDIY